MPATSRIKGFFLKAGVDYVKKNAGMESVRKVEELYGQSLSFRSLDTYPTQEEERLIKCIMQVMGEKNVTDDLDVAAGKFHFKTFLSTTYSQLVFKLTGKNLNRTMDMVNVFFPNILETVKAEGQIIDDNKRIVILRNLGYAPRHFEGFFTAFIEYMGRKATVTTKVLSDGDYEYSINMVPLP